MKKLKYVGKTQVNPGDILVYKKSGELIKYSEKIHDRHLNLTPLDIEFSKCLWNNAFQPARFKVAFDKYKFNYPFGVPNMKELVEKLKKNEKVWSRLSKEEQACFEKVGKKNCVFWSQTCQWKSPSPIFGSFISNDIYRIKSDYQPKPEIKKYEIKNRDDDLRVVGYSGYGHDNPCIHLCPTRPNFSHFELDNGTIFYVCGAVAKYMRQGYKVFACFVEE